MNIANVFDKTEVASCLKKDIVHDALKQLGHAVIDVDCSLQESFNLFFFKNIDIAFNSIQNLYMRKKVHVVLNIIRIPILHEEYCYHNLCNLLNLYNRFLEEHRKYSSVLSVEYADNPGRKPMVQQLWITNELPMDYGAVMRV